MITPRQGTKAVVRMEKPEDSVVNMGLTIASIASDDLQEFGIRRFQSSENQVSRLEQIRASHHVANWCLGETVDSIGSCYTAHGGGTLAP
ncbi:hypothetical protein ACOMHN_035643 [Nucella lapillus]